VFDLASVTKVIATTTAVMQQVEVGHLDLDAPVIRYWPEFAANGKEKVTVRQLLSHQAGLAAIDRPLSVTDLADLDIVRLFFDEPSLHQRERLPRHVGAGVRDALAVADLLGLEVALRREHGLGAADQLLHQLLGADSFLGDWQGRDVSGRVEW